MDGLEHTPNINTEPEESKNAPLQVSDAIERLLANPEILSTVASAIGVKLPTEKADKIDTANIEEKSEEKNIPSVIDASSKLPELMATVAPVIASLSGKTGGEKLPPNDDRTRLLYALRPYVNPHRREAIETIVQLARISEIIKKAK